MSTDVETGTANAEIEKGGDATEASTTETESTQDEMSKAAKPSESVTAPEEVNGTKSADAEPSAEKAAVVVPVAATPPGDQKLLSELRVTELKHELKIRELDNTGIKIILAERLREALVKEGLNPTTYLFCVNQDANAAAAHATSIPPSPKTENGLSPKKQNTEANANSMPSTVQEQPATEKAAAVSAAPESTAITTPSATPATTTSVPDSVTGPSTPVVPATTPAAAPATTPAAVVPATTPAAVVQATTSVTVEPASTSVAVVPATTPAPTTTPESNTAKAENENGQEIPMDTSNKPAEKKADAEEPMEIDAGAAKTIAPATASTASESGSTTKDTDRELATRSVWVRGLAKDTKAAELKALFAAHEKVVRAKIFTTKKQTSVCFGYVTLMDTDAQERVIRVLNATMWKTKKITVEKAEKTKQATTSSKPSSTSTPTATTGATTTPSAQKKDTSSDKAARGSSSRRDDKKENVDATPSRERRDSRRADDRRRDRPRIHNPHGRVPRGGRFARDDRRSDAYRGGSGPTRRFRGEMAPRGAPSFRGNQGLGGRLSRPGPPMRRLDERGEMVERLRRQEEENRRAKHEMEMLRIRAEKERIEREKMELQLQVALQQQQLAAMASQPGGRDRSRGHVVADRHHSSSSRAREGHHTSVSRDRPRSGGSSRAPDPRHIATAGSSVRHESSRAPAAVVVDRERDVERTRGRYRASEDSRRTSTGGGQDRSRSRHDSSQYAGSTRGGSSAYGEQRPASYSSGARDQAGASSYYASSSGRDAYSSGREPGISGRVSGGNWSASSTTGGYGGSAWGSSGGGGSSGLQPASSSWQRSTGAGDGWSSSYGGGSSGGHGQSGSSSYYRRF